MVPLARAFRQRGHEAVIATGPAMAAFGRMACAAFSSREASICPRGRRMTARSRRRNIERLEVVALPLPQEPVEHLFPCLGMDLGRVREYAVHVEQAHA